MTIAHHLRLYQHSKPEMAKLLEKSLYIDDLITGEEDNESAHAVYKKSKQIMSQVRFNLQDWSSNLHNLLKATEDCTGQQSRSHESNRLNQAATTEDGESYAKASTTPGDSEPKIKIVKVLGLNWDTASDKFFFDSTDQCNYGHSLLEKSIQFSN